MSPRSADGTPAGLRGDGEARRKRAFASAVRSLARRPRTAAEVASLLAKREYEREVIDETLARLAEQGYLDEAAVADAVVREAERRRLGSRRVAQALARRGVAGDLVPGAVEESAAGDLARARALLERRHPGGVGADPRSREKALRLLVARGFPYGIARQAIGLDVDVESGDADPFAD